MSIKDLIAAERDREPETRDVDVAVGGKLVRLHFTEIDGLDWAKLAQRFPADPGAPTDVLFGYDVHKTTRAAAPLTGSAFQGDDELPMEVTDESNDWEDLFGVMSGPDFARVADAVWNMNHYAAALRTDAARKASRPVSAKKSGSPKS